MSRIFDIKCAQRQEALTMVRNLSSESRAEASASVQGQLLGLPEYKDAQAVFVYLSFGTEIATDLLVRTSFDSGKRVLVPAMLAGEYVLSELNEEDKLVAGKYGIREPANVRLQEVPLAWLLAVVPGVAFDRSGHRLGRGGGHYDRMLQRLASAGTDLLNIGITYSCSLYDKVPVQPHDFDVDIVITENELVRCV